MHTVVNVAGRNWKEPLGRSHILYPSSERQCRPININTKCNKANLDLTSFLFTPFDPPDLKPLELESTQTDILDLDLALSSLYFHFFHFLSCLLHDIPC